jgi:uncharacterized membrane protein YqjE
VSEPDPDARANLGLFASLRRLLSTAVELGHTRLELASVELEAELHHAQSTLLWSIAAMFSAAIALLLLALTVVVVFWDTHRLLAAGAITAFFLLFAGGTALLVRHRVRTRPHLLAGTIEELKRDVASLDGARR